ncbi:MAG: alpha/beta hydrolase [Anaerolineales bacterium]|uniref:alpha/beta fold hydrolase n=1 Tax=Candidatus Villigracilis vicinus TaxID=3140679 RepID=UPI0031366EF8|nr:alpha/beta hydrolase [Anaerolineales bacterium]MBK7450221.1 alpha/beta hydrolase [Anaerolineales bacterium]
MHSQFIQTNGVKLHVMTDGPAEGTPVILLHGFPEFHYGWRKQVTELVAAGFRVITPDQRGYNLSDKPRSIRAYDVNTLAKDIVGIFDHFGIQKARLVGHDWGAVVAWTVALNHPERLEKLTILNVPHPDVMQRFILENAEQRKKSWYVFFFQIPFFVEWILRRDDYRNMARMLVGSGRKSTFQRSDIEEYKKAWSQPGALTGMLNWYRNIFRGSLRSIFQKKSARRVSIPTLILWGKNDVALSHEMVQPSLELCDNGSAVFFENATHWVQHDEANKVNKKLIEFLR